MMEIQTPAKINTLLYILSKRQDGYHELHTHLVPIDLFDTITLTANQHRGIRLQLRGRPCGEEKDNLIFKAAQAFEDHTGIEVHTDFHLVKRIPVEAGLGGGSSNAAGVLLALNHIYRLPLTMPDLKKIAVALGSDIPFFLDPRPSEARGRGEQLVPLPGYPSFLLVLVKPPFAISTAEAYRHCHPSPLPKVLPSLETFKQRASFHNQFEQTLLPDFPELAVIKQKLLQYGAVAALVSGSGSSVFGVFAEEALQQRVCRQMIKEQRGEVFCCHSLKHHHYFSV